MAKVGTVRTKHDIAMISGNCDGKLEVDWLCGSRDGNDGKISYGEMCIANYTASKGIVNVQLPNSPNKRTFKYEKIP